MPTPHRLLSLFAASAIAAALAACGGSDDDPTPPTDPGTTNPDPGTPGPGPGSPDPGTPDPDPGAPDPGENNGDADDDTHPVVGTGAASDCFNPVLVQSGTTYRWHWKTQDGLRIDGMPIAIEQVHDMRVDGGASFAGHSNLTNTHGTLHMTTHADDMVMTLSGEQNHYISLDQTSIGPVISQYGGTGHLDTDIAGIGTLMSMSFETIETPPTANRWFTLQPGESYTHTSSYTTTSTSTPGGTNTFTENESYTITYLGQTSVTVPAGTFQACRFQGMDGQGAMDVYYAVNSGLPLVITAYDEDLDEHIRLEMQPGSHINGTPVRP